ncbi:MAG: winged helix-turn-helix transcriptional regulator [Planctomycetes bacterium]|nr:winged helix-turn-helix transcriptional regulator [Planctomycetota bacterium]
MAQGMNTALIDAVAEQFKALGEPARLKLLNRLMESEANVNELAAAAGMSQANASKHLAQLAQAGLVVRSKVGTNAIYSLGDERLRELCDLMCERALQRAQTSLAAMKRRAR